MSYIKHPDLIKSIGNAVLLCLLFMALDVNAAKDISRIIVDVKDVQLAADFNRDGVIEFTEDLMKDGKRTDLNTKDKPFVFWVNDDNDDPDSETSGYDITAGGSILGFGEEPDAGNESIDGSRDLIDFFAVGINLHKYLTTTKDAGKKTYWLQHDNEAVNVVYTEMSRGLVVGGGKASDYLKKIDMSNVTDIFGSWQTQGQLSAVPVYTVTADGIEIPDEFIELIKENENKGVILVEGIKGTVQPLKIIIKDENNNKLVDASLPLRIFEVTNLYRQVSLRGDLRDELSSIWGASPTATPSVSPMLTSLASQSTNIAYLSPEVNVDKHVVFVHGYNVDEQSAEGNHNETFKRLYHSGSNQLFTGVSWNGNNGGDAAAVNYWDAVDSALYTADDLAALVNGMGDNKTVIAHSLGNMVVGSAIEDFNMSFNKFFMLNPAVALEAYSSTTNAKQMRHPYWDEFYFGTDYDANNDEETYIDQNGRGLWTVEWHGLFAGSNDERNKLTWRNRFEKVGNSTNVVQYFSSGEEVLRPAEVGTPNSFDPAAGIFEDIWVVEWFIDEPAGFNAWNVQEKSKGRNNLAALIGGGSSTGWGFNEQCETDDITTCVSNGSLTHDETQLFFDKINPELKIELIQTPFFDPFENADLMDPAIGSGTTGSNAVAVDYPDYLAYEIPALSFAAGGTVSGTFLSKNNAIDMNDKMADGWPKSRLDEYGTKEWWHSDFKNVAYRYTYKLFDDLVTKGNLNEAP